MPQRHYLYHRGHQSLTNQYQSLMTTICKQIKFSCFSLNSKNQKSDKNGKLLLDIPNVTY